MFECLPGSSLSVVLSSLAPGSPLPSSRASPRPRASLSLRARSTTCRDDDNEDDADYQDDYIEDDYPMIMKMAMAACSTTSQTRVRGRAIFRIFCTRAAREPPRSLLLLFKYY